MRAEALEQVFVRRGAGTYELRLVLESAAGSRERVTLSAPAADEAAALRFLLGYLRQNGLAISKNARVRRDRGGDLHDAPELLVQLRRAFGELAAADEDGGTDGGDESGAGGRTGRGHGRGRRRWG